MCLLRGTNWEDFQASNGHALPQAVSRQCLTEDVSVQSVASPCEICGGQSGIATGFSPSAPVFSCQYHAINAPYSSSPSYSQYQKDKRA